MKNIIDRVSLLHKDILHSINKQKKYKSFTEWEFWLETIFSPLYNEYKTLCQNISSNDHKYIDFKLIVDSMIKNDCEMICD